VPKSAEAEKSPGNFLLFFVKSFWFYFPPSDIGDMAVADCKLNFGDMLPCLVGIHAYSILLTTNNF